MLSKFINEVKDNDAKHNAEIAELKAEIAAVKRGKITTVIMSNKIQLIKGNFRSDEFNQKESV